MDFQIPSFPQQWDVVDPLRLSAASGCLLGFPAVQRQKIAFFKSQRVSEPIFSVISMAS